MIVIVFALAGALLGILAARRRGGKALDIAQHAAVYAMVFAVIGVFVTVILARG